MAVVSDIEIRLRADIARLRQDMQDGRRAVDAGFGQMGAAVAKFKSLIAGIGAGIGIAEIVGQLVTAQREFDKINSQLITATGSVEGASRAFGALKDFAASTPYALKDVTEAFIQLRNMGLTPSERALASYGNTASSMGKDLGQLIEAVADAATGEFERLKEFGIKSSKQGDDVAFTFQGVTTKVKNSSKEIEEYLMRIGETKFAGGMALQAATLDGAISSLGDTWAATLRVINENGFGDAAKSGALGLSAALTDLQAIYLEVVKASNSASGAAGEVNIVHAALTTVFETLAVMGVNVAYVITQVGKEIGGLAAQATMVAKGDFAAARAIGEAMRADAEKDRKAVDAKTAAILGASAKAQAAAKADAETRKAANKDRLAEFAIVASGAKALSAAEVKAADDAKKAREAAAKKSAADYAASIKAAKDFIASLRDESAEIGLNSEQMKRLTAERAAAKAPTKALKDQIMAEAEALAVSTAAWEMQEKTRTAAAAADDALYDRLADTTKGIDSQIKSLREQIEVYGKTEQAVADLALAKAEAALAAGPASYAELVALDQQIEKLREVRDLVGTKAGMDVAKKVADEQKDAWASFEKTAHDTFISIADGGKGAAERLRDTFKNVFFDWLYQMTIKKWIVNISTATTAGGAGGLSGLIGTTTGGQGVGGTLSSLYSSLAGGATIGGGLGTGFLGSLAGGLNGAGIGSGLTSSLGLSIGNSVAGALGPTLSGVLSSGMGALASAMPWVAGAAAVFAIGKKAFGMGPKEVTGQGISGSFGADGFSGGQATSEWMKKGGWLRSNKTGVDTADMSAAMAAQLDAAYRAMKDSTAQFAAALGAPADLVAGYSKQMKLALTGDAAKDQQAIAALFGEMGDELATRVVPGIHALTMEGETAATALARLVGEFKAVGTVLESLGAASTMALEARDRLVQLSGGLEAFGAQADFFAANFLTEAQRLAPVQRQVAEGLAALGYAGTTTTEQFGAAVLDLVQSGALATEAGAKTYAGLMALAPAFKQVADNAAALGNAMRAENDRQKSMMGGLLDNAMATLQSSVDWQRSSITAAFGKSMAEMEKHIDHLNGSIGETRALSQSLRHSLSGMAMPGSEGASRAAAQSQIANALRVAKATGVLPSAEDLRDALATVGRDSANEFGSYSEYARDMARTAADIAALDDITGKQLSVEERSLAAALAQRDQMKAIYDAQMAGLDQTLAMAQNQVDAVNGVQKTLKTLVAALAGLQAAIAGAKASPTIGADGTVSGLSVQELYRQALGREADAAGAAFWQQAYGSVVDSTEIEDFMRAAAPELAAKAAGAWSGWLSDNGVGAPVFIPQQSGTMGGNEILTELQMMNQRMERVEQHTGQFAGQFDNATGGGGPLLVQTTNTVTA